MNANQYPITLGFKQTYMPYYGPGGSIGPYHHGIDYGAPTGTPIIVSGVTIGKVGATGAVTGAHLHVDKSANYPSAFAGYVSPSDWPTITGTVVFAGSAGTAGNMTVIKATNGYYYRFLHQSQINVAVGQVIGSQGENSVFQNIDEVKEAYRMMRGSYGTDAEMRPWIGQSKQRWIQLATKETDSLRQQLADVKKALANEQAKPPREVVKIVEKIVEKPVEKIVEVEKPVDEQKVVEGWLKRLWQGLFKR